MIKAVLKWIILATVTLATGTIAALVSQRVRDGLCLRPHTQSTLKQCRKEMTKEQREYVKEQREYTKEQIKVGKVG